MSSSDEFHEEEVVLLTTNTVRSLPLLSAVLTDLGLTGEDEFYVFDRTEQVQPWQSFEVFSIHPLKRGIPVEATVDDVTEGEPDVGWDTLRLEYPMATLPPECVDVCVDKIEQIAARLELEIEFKGRKLASGELRQELRSIVSEIVDLLGASPGDETLAILIEDAYPR